MMKKLSEHNAAAPLLFLALSAVLLLAGLGIYALADRSAEDVSMPETTLIVATDLHYIAPELTDHGAYFESMIESSDGKVMEYIEELTDAFLEEVIARKPMLSPAFSGRSISGILPDAWIWWTRTIRCSTAGRTLSDSTGNISSPSATRQEPTSHD